jgi:UDP-glucose 4-epimerase
VKILITGGFGNLGCWITQECLKKGWDVTVATSSGRKPKFLADAGMVILNLTDPISVKRALADQNYDSVIHAGSLNDGFEEGYYWKSYRVNVEGTSSLLHNLSRQNLQSFIYLSTFHVYGIDSGVVNENTPPNPKNDYAASHLAAEEIVKMHSRNGLPATILRLTNGYGNPVDAESTKWHLIFNDLLAKATRDARLCLKADPETRRDFVWMGDIAKAVCKLASEPCRKYEMMNLAFGYSISLSELADKIHAAYFEVFGKSIPLEYQAGKSLSPCRLQVVANEIWSRVGFSPQMRISEEAANYFRRSSSL